VDQIDLVRDRGLEEIGRIDTQPVVGQRSAIVDDAIDAGVEAAAWRLRDIERSFDRQVATDLDQVVERAANDIRLSEAIVEIAAEPQNAIAIDGQRYRCRTKSAGPY